MKESNIKKLLQAKLKIKKLRQAKLKLISEIIEKMEKLNKQQDQIIQIDDAVEKKQQNHEFWIKATRYLTLIFIIGKIMFFCYSKLLHLQNNFTLLKIQDH